LARNSRLMTDMVLTPVNGPGTKELLYEVAAMTVMGAASGTCAMIGPRSNAGVHNGNVSGLEARFMAEVGHAAAGMPRKQADELVTWLVDKYKDTLDKRPIGKHFTEVYDLKTVKPKPEWLAMYEEVKDELRARGLAL
jgi:methylamine--corrinoid protein Co-methyltransferase